MTTFNLIDEPWIDCAMVDRSQRSLGLKNVLAQAQVIEEIRGDSPLVIAALHRLFLAVLHRNFSVSDSQDWRTLWEGRSFDVGVLAGYFKVFGNRFDLFDEKRPFYQVAGLDWDKGGSSARLLFNQDNNATLFSHLTTADPPELTPSEAARLLLGIMAFDTGGTKTSERGAVSANAAMSNKGAIVLAKGGNLFETLMLNLCRYAPGEGDPWVFDRERDIPAWERDEENAPRRPDTRRLHRPAHLAESPHQPSARAS